jgi:hypothetical protein
MKLGWKMNEPRILILFGSGKTESQMRAPIYKSNYGFLLARRSFTGLNPGKSVILAPGLTLQRSWFDGGPLLGITLIGAKIPALYTLVT